MQHSGLGPSHFLFTELRLRYIKRLRSYLPIFENAAEDSSLSSEGLEMLREKIHKLSGSGGTYGFPDVTSAAMSAEDTLDAVFARQIENWRPEFTRELLELSRAVRSAIDIFDDGEIFQSDGRKKRPGPNAEKRSRRVVVVDDDPCVSDLLWASLSQIGFDVDVARDGVAAIALIKHRRPDLVILDRNLPLLSGTSVLMELQSLDGEPMKTIILSSKPPSPWFEEQDIHYVQKPFIPEAIVRLARELLAEEETSAGDLENPQIQQG